MTVRPLCGILALLITVNLFAAAPAPFLLKGKVALGDAYVFNVKPNSPPGRAEWLALGEVIDGYTLAAFDHPTDTLTLKKGDTTLQVPMDIAAIGENVSPADLRQRDAERMLRMKPLLEAGQPIKGSVVTLIDGKAIEQHAEFVIGKETRIDAGDNSIYVVTPKLNPDGSVMYQIELLTSKPDGTPAQRVSVPRLIATPWGQFSMLAGDHGFGFAPTDGGGP
ncbi:MAG: hypothetical protein JWQ62_314 [Lacunisphaera sp.]|nr:hypothetical protein [Lacunisphaera sp.]